MQRKPKGISWSIKQICTMIDKGTMTFDNPLQRATGQWDSDDASLLIDSTLTMFVPEVVALQIKQDKGNIYDIIDGIQRLTYIHSYVKDQWNLNELNPFVLETTNEEHNISGLKFSELPEEVRDAILAYSITVKYFEITEDDDEESMIKEIFRRLNKGTRVSGEHLALVSAKKNVQDFVHKMITEHKLFTDVAKFTNKAVLKSDKQMTILQSIIYVSGLDFCTFSTKDVEKFFMTNDITEEVLNRTEGLFTVIADTFNNEYNKFCTKINITSMVGFLSNQENIRQVKNFLVWYSTGKNSKPGDAFKNNCGASSTKKEKVLGRVKGLEAIMIDKLKKEEKEAEKETETEENTEVA